MRVLVLHHEVVVFHHEVLVFYHEVEVLSLWVYLCVTDHDSELHCSNIMHSDTINF